VALLGANWRLIVAIEATPDELLERTPALEYNGRAFRIWSEVDNFSQPAGRSVCLHRGPGYRHGYFAPLRN